MKVSLIASSVRPQLWDFLFYSLKGSTVECEIIFAGNKMREKGIENYYEYTTHSVTTPCKITYKFIQTENIKPSQCYEIARRASTGEVVCWIADDAEFPNDVIGKAYKYWKLCNNENLILSIQTKETGYNCPKGQLFDMNIHRFFGACPAEPYNPLMAPIGMMSRAFLDELGGFDKRYVCGQYENDLVMRAYEKGATVEIFGSSECFIDIDHLGKSILIGESKDEKDFLNRPFATGYKKDREILENSWCRQNSIKLMNLIKEGRRQIYPNEIHDISKFQLDKFEPYENDNILTVSQSNKGKWE